VEDHADTRAGMVGFLVQEGAVVEEAPDGATGLAKIKTGLHDVVLLDLMLPDMDGTEILKSLEENRPARLKGVLVLTGDVQRHGHGILPGIRPDALLQKPVDLELLVTALQTLQRHGSSA
jgi:CheY-like chemotaxis protein